MKPSFAFERYRVGSRPLDNEGGSYIIFSPRRVELRIIASWGGNWDHVSISTATRTPTWEEMEFVKRIFFKDDETAIQIHPPIKDYVNCHPYVLHLWRPQNVHLILPPKEFI